MDVPGTFLEAMKVSQVSFVAIFSSPFPLGIIFCTYFLAINDLKVVKQVMGGLVERVL